MCTTARKRRLWNICAQRWAESKSMYVRQVARRPPTMVNAEQATGEVEVEVDHLTVLNPCGVLPFPVSGVPVACCLLPVACVGS